MANMSYCRFENTLEDLKDCRENMYDELEGIEFRKRAQLVQLCRAIASEFDGYAFKEAKEDNE